MRTLPPIVAGLAACALLTAACSADLQVEGSAATPTPPVEATEPTPTPAPTATPTPPPAGQAVVPDDTFFELGPRIAVETADGQIHTMLGDGSNQIPLTNPDEGTINRRPTWSLDANRLGWVTSHPDGAGAEVRAARFDGSDWFEASVPSTPRMLSWGPGGTQLATLSPGDTGLTLGVVSVPDGEHVEVDSGSPFWFSWSPDGDGFLVHASGLRLDFVPVDGPSQVLEPNPGSFQAPRWLNGAVQLVYADEVAGEDYLVVAGADGAGRRALATYDGYLQFVVAPDSGWVALQVIDESRAPVPDVITASFQDDFIDEIDPILRNELTVIATFGGDPFVVYPSAEDFTPRPVVAFYWSPDGSTLAWLVQLDPGDNQCASETATYEWQFMIENTVVAGPRFRPTATFACDYIPFFDQLDQSVSFWSPDGVILTYAGTDQSTGERGIWNVDVGAFSPPTLISDGEIGVWSPQAAGSAGESAL